MSSPGLFFIFAVSFTNIVIQTQNYTGYNVSSHSFVYINNITTNDRMSITITDTDNDVNVVCNEKINRDAKYIVLYKHKTYYLSYLQTFNANDSMFTEMNETNVTSQLCKRHIDVGFVMFIIFSCIPFICAPVVAVFVFTKPYCRRKWSKTKNGYTSVDKSTDTGI